MIEDYRLLAAVIAAHKGRMVVGRTRLQKTIKLLQRLGLKTSFGYSIHFYGPYSEDLQAGLTLLRVIGLASEEPHHTPEGTTYYVITASEDADPGLVADHQQEINRMAAADPTVLELAATYDAFRDQGSNHDQAMARLKAKKGSKCNDGNDQKALQLLNELGFKTKWEHNAKSAA